MKFIPSKNYKHYEHNKKHYRYKQVHKAGEMLPIKHSKLWNLCDHLVSYALDKTRAYEEYYREVLPAKELDNVRSIIHGFELFIGDEYWYMDNPNRELENAIVENASKLFASLLYKIDDIDSTVKYFFYNHIKAFKCMPRHGYPGTYVVGDAYGSVNDEAGSSAFEADLDTIIEALYIQIHVDSPSDEQLAVVNKGMTLLGELMYDLWD